MKKINKKIGISFFALVLLGFCLGFMSEPASGSPGDVIVNEGGTDVDIIILSQYKKVQQTKCIDQENGQLSGYSNNCIKGSGSCVDHTCGDGETEAPMD